MRAVLIRLPWLLAGLLVLGCGWIYRDGASFGFVGLDDDYNILFNPHLGPLSLHRVQWAFTDWEYARRYLPLGWLGFSAVFGFSGLAPVGYHLALLAWHCVNALLLFGVLRSFARRELGDDASPWRTVVVFLGAAFWAWHPLRVESVAWASGLLYAQTTAFMFAALWLQLAGRRIAAVVCHALALLTYPAALGLWPIFVLLDARREGWRRAFTLNVGHLIAAGALLVITMLGRFQVGGVWPAVPTVAEFPLWQRGLQTLYVDAHYLWRPWWPVGLTPVDSVALDLAHPSGRLIAGAIVTLLLAVSLAFSAWVRKRAGWFALAHVAVLVPVLGVVEKPYFPADRYALLPHLILSAALVVVLAQLRARRTAVVAVGAVVLAACAGLSRAQTEIWRDEAAMWRHISTRITVDDLPVLACARPALSLLRSGDRAAAFALIDAGRRRRPDDAMLRATRDEMLRVDRDVSARAKARGLDAPPPPAAELHHALGLELARAGDIEAAAQHFALLARIAPEYYARITRAAPPPPAR